MSERPEPPPRAAQGRTPTWFRALVETLADDVEREREEGREISVAWEDLPHPAAFRLMRALGVRIERRGGVD